jgi:deoxycytidylate deaminase
MSDNIKIESNNHKYNRLVDIAAKRSLKSTSNTYKHGAVIYQGKKIICSGYNQSLRTVYKGNYTCTIHAEMDTIVKFLNSFIKIHIIKHNEKKLRRKLHKYSICVVRISENIDGTIECMNSLPCRDCVHKLQMVGLNKVCYTSDNSQIYTTRIKNIDINNINYTGVMRKDGVLERTRVSNLLA